MSAPAPLSVADLAHAMEAIAPSALAEPWDNVGLVIGDPAAPLTGVLLCIDLTLEVIEEAKTLGASAVVAYHPPIFKGLKRFTPGSAESVAYEAMAAGLAVYSPHTALDVAAGGTNDVLADLLGLDGREPLSPRPSGDAGQKLVTFVPSDAVDRVADAMFNAGAGRIGDYDRCSFRTPGTGTFRGGDASNPAAGERGRDERADELRLEVVVPVRRSAAVVTALRESHPYEEVAFDLVPLAADPTRMIGLGRIGDLLEPLTCDDFLHRVRRQLGVPVVLVAGPTSQEVRRVAVCAGSCGELLDDAAKRGADVYVTGELRHHDALRASRLGLTAACVLHSNSERPTLAVVARRLEAALPGLRATTSERDCDPFEVR